MNWVENRNKTIRSSIVTLMICIPFISLLNGTLFAIYNATSLYLYSLLTAIILMLQGKIGRKKLCFFLVLSFYLFISVVLNGGGVGSVITFLLPIIMLECFERIDLKPYQKNIINNLCLFMIIYLSFASRKYATDWIYYRYHGINPNTMASFLSYALIYFSIFRKRNGIRSNLLLLLLFALASYGFTNYQARGGMLISLLYFLMSLFEKKINKKLFMSITIITIVVSLIFPFVYLYLYEQNYDLVFLNKSLYTGRESIWQAMIYAFNSQKSAWLIGLGSKVSLWSGHELNVHNNTFAVIVNFGIIGFLLYYLFILRSLYKKTFDFSNKLLMFGFYVSIIAWGIIEVTSLWSTTFSLAYLLLGLNLRSETHNKAVKV